MQCEKCNSENIEFIGNRKLAGGLFMLGVIFFPIFWIFWPMAIARLFGKDKVYKCKDCKKTVVIKIDNTVKG